MSENLKDILSHLKPGIDQDTLLQYLQDKLTEEQKHEVERQMLESEFEQDALEGLESVQNKEKLSILVEQMNRDLRKKIEKKKKFREKLRYKNQPWIFITAIIIILLIVLSYLVIYKLINN